ncbi:MAG: aminotransferase class III-fold pyridoxal phosphate-dependent enzyme [Thermoplasmatales archaeon]|nr:aminotransferase class III-fold pyridoxal phosphate-dependent enzyme [Thermoplasmatales archaeon]MCW6171055.1 aminotransferase class III-fold pyridoxal phosphate-dependent enzyme [Thermoplasmatales archaeon]
MITAQNIMDLEIEHEAKTYQKLPVVASRASGSIIWDVNGKDYVDLSSGYGVAILGYNNHRIMNAIMEQFNTVSILHSSLYNETRADFLEKLSSVVPKNITSFYLGNSGTEAIEASMKAAIKFTGRKLLVSMKNGYHGKTLGSLAITHSEKYTRSFRDVIYKGVQFVDYGDANAIRELPNLNEIAAVFVEPVQGEGGIILPGSEYLKELREITEEHGILLIADEIQSGLGRTGKMWAHQWSGVEPDIMTIGKGIGGGIPMGIAAGEEEIMNSLTLGEMSSTLGGNPLACAAGIEVLNQLSKELLSEVTRKGKYMISRLSQSLSDSKIVREVRGIGMMQAISLRVKFIPVLMNMIQNGVIPLYSGISIIRLLPPYIISDSEIDIAVNRITSSINEFENGTGAAH